MDFHPQTGALANRKSIVFPMSECLFLLATELSWDISATFQKTPSPVSQQAIWLTVEQLWCFFFIFFITPTSFFLATVSAGGGAPLCLFYTRQQ